MQCMLDRTLTDCAIQACTESHCHTWAGSRLLSYFLCRGILRFRNGTSLCECEAHVGTSVCVCAQRVVARVMPLVCEPDMTQGEEEENGSSVMMTITLAVKSGPVTCVKAPTHECWGWGMQIKLVICLSCSSSLRSDCSQQKGSG